MNWPLLTNSLLVAGLTTLAASLLGFTSAVCLAGVGTRLRRWLLALAVVALAMPPFLATNCWLDLLGETGVLRHALPLNIYSLAGAVLVLSLLLWPITLFAALGAWQQLEPSQLESEPLLRGPTLCRWLLWPMARNAVVVAGVLTFVLALNNFAVPAILQVKVAPAIVWVGFNTNLDSLAALREGWPLIVAPMALLVVLGRTRKLAWPRSEGGVSAALFRRQVGQGWFVVSQIVVLLLMTLSVALPLAELAWSRRTWLELLPALSAGMNAATNSVLFAGLTATATVAGALVAARIGPAISISRSSRGNEAQTPKTSEPPHVGSYSCVRGLRQVGGPALLGSSLLWLPFLVPGVLLGIALIWLLNRPGLDWFYRSTGVVLLALAIRYFAPAWFGTAAARLGVDRDLIDAARLDGARGWTLFRCVVWPQIAPQVAAVWYVVYLLCLWDVETLVLILPPGGETLALRVFNLLHYGHSGQVNALCVWLLILAVAPLAVGRLARGISNLKSQISNPSALLGALGLILLTGCSEERGDNAAPLPSQVFRRVEILGRRGAGAGEFNKPRSVAVDQDDNLYVADMTGRVQKFSPDGRWLLAWQTPQTDLGKPKGMDCDHDGNVVVIEPHYQRVNHFTPDGRLVAQWGGHLTNRGPFSLPRAVAVNSRGDVIVSEYTLAERVQVFAAYGKAKRCEFGCAGSGPGEFNRPEGVGVDGADRIYVADSCNHRIQVFSPDGKFLRAHGHAGSAAGEFSYPYDVRVDAAGRQFVCDYGNSRIQVFDAHDKLIEMIGKAGAKPGEFSNPWSLALDSKGNLYVADAGNHRVQKLVKR
ncbi:MAG: ABC transporter permease subunit [Verrucomicrobia bacterium]|nr:ABC transporter permease subunit [Verrucomicrobiota bacterium]